MEILACDFQIKGAWLGFKIPQTHREMLSVLQQRASERRLTQLYVKVDLPKKIRTTGYRSQNAHAHGHATTISEYTGYYVNEIMDYAKGLAVSWGYPTHVGIGGDIVPISEKDASTTEYSYVIEELHKIASEMGIQLKEYEDV